MLGVNLHVLGHIREVEAGVVLERDHQEGAECHWTRQTQQLCQKLRGFSLVV